MDASLPFRTGVTDLSDAELIIFDVLFDGGTTFDWLRNEKFGERVNFRYSHELGDEQLADVLRRLTDCGLITTKLGLRNSTCYFMTELGGDWWSLERRPIWEKFASIRSGEIHCGKTLMSIVSPAAEITESLLMVGEQVGMWTLHASRIRRTQIRNHRPVSWRSFPILHVAVAIDNSNSDNQVIDWTTYEHCRTWWRDIGELQSFVNAKRDKTED